MIGRPSPHELQNPRVNGASRIGETIEVYLGEEPANFEWPAKILQKLPGMSMKPPLGTLVWIYLPAERGQRQTRQYKIVGWQGEKALLEKVSPE